MGDDSLVWFKSSLSVSQGACVEAARLPGGGIAVRDSKDHSKAALAFTRTEWGAFIGGAKNGEFDLT